ncbi:hypothetical protein H6503_02735 [Candidatus Woesearchaeota archaeon]|nr:hypothetical protein [Candidatus Woesearchaeota archaeon]
MANDLVMQALREVDSSPSKMPKPKYISKDIARLAQINKQSTLENFYRDNDVKLYTTLGVMEPRLNIPRQINILRGTTYMHDEDGESLMLMLSYGFGESMATWRSGTNYHELADPRNASFPFFMQGEDYVTEFLKKAGIRDIKFHKKHHFIEGLEYRIILHGEEPFGLLL